MTSSSPPILPISNPQTTTITTTTLDSNSSSAPIATPAFRLFLTRFTDSAKQAYSQRRSWSELTDRSAFTKPESLSDSITRIRKNLTYFRINYLTVVFSILALSLLTNPFSLLILVGILAAWMFMYLFRPSEPPLVLFGRTFSDRETLLGLSLGTVLAVFMTSVGSLLISASLIGVGLVCAHGAFRVPEDLFLGDEQEGNVGSGLLSFISGAASNVGVSVAAPMVAAGRV